VKVNGWGKYPVIDADIHNPYNYYDCETIVLNNSIIPRGLGRSYGDSSLSKVILNTSQLNKILFFDPINGLLCCQSGVSFDNILNLIVKAGWFMPVTPGTSKITLGGAIASDVHGKNHHLAGSFSDYIISFEIMLGSGEIVIVTPTNMPDLFKATCGGMGLTGLVLSATIKLIPVKSTFISQKILRANNIDQICEYFEINSLKTYTVAWIDCLARGGGLGRSLMFIGEHAEEGGFLSHTAKNFNLPFNMPSWFLSAKSIKTFNNLYYHNILHNINDCKLISYRSFFYPLDRINNWNNLYGNNGFIQYQFVLPKLVGLKGLRMILDVISKNGSGSFLAVLKAFGKGNKNYLSFPIEGYSLALDFKLETGIMKLINDLNSVIIELGGKIYLTKDAIMSEKMFKLTYKQWYIFEEIRAKYGAVGKFKSNQSIRLGLQ